MTSARCNFEPDKAAIAEWFYYSEGSLFWLRNTRRIKAGNIAGSVETDGYRRIRFKGRKLYAHRLIWILHNNTHPELIDHIDGDRSNNAISNLRPASKSLNAINSKLFCSNNVTKTRGVQKSGNRYVARLWLDGIRLNLGSYASISEAEAAYTGAVLNHFNKVKTLRVTAL